MSNQLIISDMQQAAFLIAGGAGYPEVERKPNGRPVFIFEDEDGALAWDAEKYRLGAEDCMVNVRNLWRAWDELKRSLGPREVQR